MHSWWCWKKHRKFLCQWSITFQPLKDCLPSFAQKIGMDWRTEPQKLNSAGLWSISNLLERWHQEAAIRFFLSIIWEDAFKLSAWSKIKIDLSWIKKREKNEWSFFHFPICWSCTTWSRQAWFDKRSFWEAQLKVIKNEKENEDDLWNLFFYFDFQRGIFLPEWLPYTHLTLNIPAKRSVLFLLWSYFPSW